MDCNLPGSSIHGIFQARALEWTTISFSRESSQPRDRTQGSNPGLLHCRQTLYLLSYQGNCNTMIEREIYSNMANWLSTKSFSEWTHIDIHLILYIYVIIHTISKNILIKELTPYLKCVLWPIQHAWCCFLLSHELQESETVSCSVVSNSLWPPWTVTHQAPLCVEFPRQNYWSG